MQVKSDSEQQPLMMQGQNIDNQSRLSRLTALPLRKLRLEHNSLRVKQQILAKFMHLHQRESSDKVSPVQLPSNLGFLNSGAYSIRVVSKEQQAKELLNSRGGHNTEIASDTRDEYHKAFRASISSSQSINKKRCTCGRCDECSKNFESFLKLYVEDDSIPEISAKSWCLWRKEKGRYSYIYGKRPYKQREIASLTKVMTSLVVADRLQRWNLNPALVTLEIPQYCPSIKGTTANLQPGQFFTVENLLYALMLPSGNDAAVVLAESFGLMLHLEYKRKLKSFDPYNPESFKLYSHKSYCHVFVNAMNEKCRDFGLSNTVFYNPHGNDAFDPGRNTSTALQIGRLCFTLLQNSYLSNMVNTKNYKSWINTNKLLWEGFHGIKTGVNEVSGPCLSAAYKDIVVVILNSKTMEERWIEVKRLVRWVSARRYSHS